MNKPKLIRITTVPLSLKVLLKGQLHFMSQFFEVVGISSSGSELDEVKLREGIRVKAVEMTRQITPFQDLKSLWKLYQILKKEKPEIVHTHTPKAGLLGMMAAKLAGVPIRIHTVAGMPLMEAKGLKRMILNQVEKVTYSSATQVYPNSNGLYEFILDEKFTPASKLKIIGQGSSNGIDTDYFSPEQISEKQKEELKSELGIQNEDFVFVFVGRLVKDKGINELVFAFSKLEARSSKLLLVGDFESELDPLTSETLIEINENPAILSIGFQSDVRPYFAISHCLVFPSYREGFPNVVLQAGAMGLPSIVSDINGCNEIVSDSQNGIIIPVKNAIAIQEAMQKLMADKALYEKLKVNARTPITSRFEQKRIWDELKSEYQQLLLNLK